MKPESVACPLCGGKMVSRQQRATGQRFWGCARYPECRGTLNTDGEAPRRPPTPSEDGTDRSPCERMRASDRRRWDR